MLDERSTLTEDCYLKLMNSVKVGTEARKEIY